MSIKLPYIGQRESASNSPQAKSKEFNPDPDPAEEEEDYADHDFEEAQQIEHPKPLQTITVLKQKAEPLKSQSELEVKVKKKASKSDLKKELEIQELQKLLQDRLKTVNELQLSTSEKKKEIKSIGDRIDKDLNKSLLRATRQNSVNIRDIFSATPTKSNNQQVNLLNEELKKIRFIIKTVKQDIFKLQQSLADPVTMMNEERGIDYKTKIRSTEQGIKTIQHEKCLLQEEILRGGKDLSEEEEKQRAEDYQKYSQQLAGISSTQKQEKFRLYQLERQDILLMEKTKFFQERESQIGAKRQAKPTEKDKERLEKEIKELILQINATVEERNRTEIDKKQQAKALSVEASSFQTKNWQLFNKLREIDAFLLQHYQKKTRRKDVKLLQKTVDVMEKSASGNIDSQTVLSENLYKSKLSERNKVVNDKNLKTSEIMIEKKKVYDFGLKESCEGEINLSDEFLGPKITIKSLAIRSGKDKIYSITAHYRNSHENQIQGLLMGSRNIPENSEAAELVLSQQEEINFIHTGSDKDKAIAFIHLVTSEGQQLKWGSQDQLVKSEQKHIKQYEFCFLKAKLGNSRAEGEEAITSLLGLTIATTYLAPK